LDIGKLRHRITIETPTTGTDGSGGITYAWNTFAVVWGYIEPLTAHRLFQAKQANADTTGIIHIRYVAGLLPTMRVKYGSRIFLITSVIADEQRSETQILYKEALD
jgi:SPP1 family predicted phage head-tail adaptor